MIAIEDEILLMYFVRLIKNENQQYTKIVEKGIWDNLVK